MRAVVTRRASRESRGGGQDPAGDLAILKDKDTATPTRPLGAKDMNDLALFVAKGQIDVAKYVDAATKKPKGDAAKGEAYFNTLCAGCHGNDGKKVKDRRWARWPTTPRRCCKETERPAGRGDAGSAGAGSADLRRHRAASQPRDVGGDLMVERPQGRHRLAGLAVEQLVHHFGRIVGDRAERRRVGDLLAVETMAAGAERVEIDLALLASPFGLPVPASTKAVISIWPFETNSAAFMSLADSCASV